MIVYLYYLVIDWFKFLWFVIGDPIKFLVGITLTLLLVYITTRLISRGFFISWKEVNHEWKNIEKIYKIKKGLKNDR